MATRQDITAADEWFCGEDRDLWITFYGPDDVTEEPLDGTELLRWVLAPTKFSDEVLIRKGNSGDDADLEISGGKALVHIRRADTLALRAGTMWHTCAKINPDAETVSTYGDAVLLASPISAPISGQVLPTVDLLQEHIDEAHPHPNETSQDDGNIDGGTPDTEFGGTTPIDGGTV